MIFFSKIAVFLSLVHRIDLILHINNVFNAFDIFCKNHSHYTTPSYSFIRNFMQKLGVRSFSDFLEISIFD